MRDIENIKRQHERELRLAQIENDIEEVLKFPVSVVDLKVLTDDVTMLVTFGDKWNAPIPLEIARKIIVQFPYTDDTEVHGVYVTYDLQLINDHNGNTVLRISYINGECGFVVILDPSVVADYVVHTFRTLAPWEMETHTTINDSWEDFDARRSALR